MGQLGTSLGVAAGSKQLSLLLQLLVVLHTIFGVGFGAKTKTGGTHRGIGVAVSRSVVCLALETRSNIA